MQTTYKQQMAAIKRAMEPKSISVASYSIAAHKQWLALNDAYSTLAALRLNKSLNKK